MYGSCYSFLLCPVLPSSEQPCSLQLEEEIQAIHAIVGISPGAEKQSSEGATQ